MATTALAVGCGPAITLGGDETGTGGTGFSHDDALGETFGDGPLQCIDDDDCPSGDRCNATTLVCEADDRCADGTGGCSYEDGLDDNYNDDDYNDDYYDDGPYYECETDLDCAPADYCSPDGTGCAPLPALPTCGLEQTPALLEARPGPDIPGGNIISLAFVDANGDAAMDLVVGRTDGTELLLGPGQEAATPLPLPDGATAADVDSGDFNGDGMADLAVALGAGGVALLAGDGAGGFTLLSADMADGLPTSSVVAVDFEATGSMDLLAGGKGGVLLYPGDGAGGFANPIELSSARPDHMLDSVPAKTSASIVIASGTLTEEWFGGPLADDRPDLTPFVHPRVDGWIPLAAGEGVSRGLLGVGRVGPTTALRLETSQGQTAYRLDRPVLAGATGDLLQDGSPDFVLLSDDRLIYLSHERGPQLGCMVEYPLVGPASHLAVGDISGDGRADIVTATGGVLQIYEPQ